MKTTGLFTVHYYQIEAKEIGEPIYIIPFGDIHKFGHMHADDRWREFCEWAKEKKRAYFIGMGDYTDIASASERNILKDHKLHESTILTLDQLYDQFTRDFYNDISFMGGRCIGLIEGNHFGEFSYGATTTQKLCELLKCKYLGVSSFIRLSIKHGKHSAAIDIWAHHGLGAARTIGGSLNKVEQMGEQAEADIYIMSHDHKKSVGYGSKLKLSQAMGNIGLVHRKQLYARCGSFLLGYVPDKVSYVADANMKPTDLGVVKIELTPRRPYHDALRIDIHASI